MNKLTLSALGVLALAAHAPGTILLNEIHINPPSNPDLNYEFVELRSTTNEVEFCTGLTLLIIENNGGSIGEVEEAIDLSALSTGANGLLLIGNGYAGFPAGGPWSGSKSSFTTTGDPSAIAPHSGLGDDDIGPDGGLTFLLVSGWTGMTTPPATPTSLGDVDVNNNNVLDWDEVTKPVGSQTTRPFTTLVDSIGFRDLGNNPIRLPYTTADLNAHPVRPATYPPDNISRRLSRAAPADQNNASAWYGANLLIGAPANSVVYDPIQYFGQFKGEATPGRENLDAAPVPGNFLINEVEINPSGVDGNFEYIEIINTVVSNGSLASSLQGYSLLLIGSSATTAEGTASTELGTIIDAWDLGGMSTGTNGLLLLGNDYPSGRAPWGKLIDPLTQLGDPVEPPGTPGKYSSLGDDDVGSNNGFTLLLVKGYTGLLDQTVGNPEGVFTAQPWTAIVDSVGFDEIDSEENLTLGKSYALAKLDPTYLSGTETKHYNPDHLARKLGNTAPNSAGAWYGGKLASRSPFGIGLLNGFFIGGFRGEGTPGRSNLAAAPTSGTIRLNEIHLNPPPTTPDTPDGGEYIELINPDKSIVGMSDLWLLVVDANGADIGVINGVLDLRGMSTGPNGLAFFADSGEEGTTWGPFIPAETLRDDPNSFNDDSTENTDFNFKPQDFLEPNEGNAILLVRGFTGSLDQDLDADNNGAFDAVPWTELVDSISFGTSVDASVPLLTFPGFDPGNLSRYNRNFRLDGDATANSAAAWFGGELQGDPEALLTSTNYTTNWTGSFRGAASPGRLNHSATPHPTASLLLNEIHANPPGADTNKEFIELTSTNRQSLSTNTYTILLLDVDGGLSRGKILEAWSLDGLSTGSNGLLLTGSQYTSPASLPWVGSDPIAAGTHLGSPAGMDFEDIGHANDNGSMTVLLVKDFLGRVGDDLDLEEPLGVLDAEVPWSKLVDTVGFRGWDSPESTVYAGVDLTQPHFTPDNVSRYIYEVTAGSGKAWYGGDILGTADTSLVYDLTERFPSPSKFTGAVTPGQPNLTPYPDEADADNDSVVNLIEIALGMNRDVPDAEKLPGTGTVAVNSESYPIIKITRPSGGTQLPPNKHLENGILHTVQFSTDLDTWSDQVRRVGVAPGDDPAFETATYRPTTEGFAQGTAAGQMFLRLKVERQ